LNLEVRDLVLVQAVVEQGSLSAAARHLGLTQPALSRQLAEAERRLGTVLFLRQGRRLHLAPPGHRLLAAAQELLPNLARAEKQLGQSDLQPEGEAVRVAATTPYAYLWLLPAFRKHADKHGGLTFQLQIPGPEDVFEWIRTGQTEAVVSPGPGIQPDLRAVSLFREELFIYLSTKHPAARQTFFPAGDFESVDLLTATPLTEQPALIHLFRAQGIRPRRVVSVPLAEALLELAAHGHGAACLSRRATLGSPRRGQLTELKLTARGTFLSWRAFFLRTRAETLTSKFHDLAAACME
jgi:LysR family transcriptional regulator, regulator for metE and metH